MIYLTNVFFFRFPSGTYGSSTKHGSDSDELVGINYLKITGWFRGLQARAQ